MPLTSNQIDDEQGMKNHHEICLPVPRPPCRRAWFFIDLGLWVIPSAYTLRHARGYGRSALRNWLIQVSKDSQTWLTLMTHSDDSSLNEPG